MLHFFLFFLFAVDPSCDDAVCLAAYTTQEKVIRRKEEEAVAEEAETPAATEEETPAATEETPAPETKTEEE